MKFEKTRFITCCRCLSFKHRTGLHRRSDFLLIIRTLPSARALGASAPSPRSARSWPIRVTIPNAARLRLSKGNMARSPDHDTAARSVRKLQKSPPFLVWGLFEASTLRSSQTAAPKGTASNAITSGVRTFRPVCQEKSNRRAPLSSRCVLELPAAENAPRHYLHYAYYDQGIELHASIPLQFGLHSLGPKHNP